MSGPREYLPDTTKGITKPEDLSKSKIVFRNRNYKHYTGPSCQRRC